MCIWASIREKQNWIWERVVSFGNLYIILKGGGEENVGLQREWMTFRKDDWSGEEEMKEVWCLWLSFLGCGSSVGVLSCDESSYPVDENSGEGIEDKRVPFGETLSLFFWGFFELLILYWGIFLPGESHGQRSLVGCSPWGREESNTTERLHFHFILSCIGEGNGNQLQCSCLENPRDSGAWWAAIYGVTLSRTRWKRLSSSSSSIAD